MWKMATGLNWTMCQARLFPVQGHDSGMSYSSPVVPWPPGLFRIPGSTMQGSDAPTRSVEKYTSPWYYPSTQNKHPPSWQEKSWFFRPWPPYLPLWQGGRSSQTTVLKGGARSWSCSDSSARLRSDRALFCREGHHPSGLLWSVHGIQTSPFPGMDRPNHSSCRFRQSPWSSQDGGYFLFQSHLDHGQAWS